MGALLDTVSDAVAPKMPTNADFGTDGRWKGPNPYKDLKFDTPENMRASITQGEPTPSGGLYDTIASAVNSPPQPGSNGRYPPAPEAPVRPSAAAIDEMMPGSEARTAARVAANQVTGVGSSILGGWKALGVLARGGSLADAANEVDRTAQEGTYVPPAASHAATVLEYNPANVLGRVANRAGEVTTDVTGSPAVGAAVNTGLQAAPLALIRRAPESARVAPKVVGSGSIADVKPAITAVEPNTVPTIGEIPVEPPQFAEAAPAAEPGKSLPASEQQRRVQTLRSIGMNDTDMRQSAVSGDPKASATDFQQSKVINPAGDFVRSVLDNERQALTNHGEQIVRDTGGTLGLDSQALEARGHTILAPLEGFKQWVTDQTKGLYAEARAKAQGQPVALNQFQDVLGTDSKFANTDTIELRKGINARMKELGMIDKEGQFLPATVDQAENLRQYVNEEWSPKSNTRIRELKNALDTDVTTAAGEDTFKKARALHATKMAIFEDPKGISSILDSEGINRKVPVEKVADTIAALPNAQFAHIVNTLKTVPAELQPQAQAALAEIKAHIANRVLDAGSKRVGQWGARDVAAQLNKNAAKLPLIFEPEELAQFRNLNDAGQILAKDQSYPGAAVQEHNLVRRGAMGAVRSGFAAGGAAAGGLIGMPVQGAAIGDMVGGAVTGRMAESAALKAAQGRMVKLADFPK